MRHILGVGVIFLPIFVILLCIMTSFVIPVTKHYEAMTMTAVQEVEINIFVNIGIKSGWGNSKCKFSEQSKIGLIP